MDLNCDKCQKPTNIKLKYRMDGVNKLNFECIDFTFGVIMGIDEEYRL